MIDRKEKLLLFEKARLTFYAVLVAAGIIVCKLPFQYLCDYEGYSCIFCGMRHAVDYIVAFDFKNAVASNPLILGIGIILVDVLYIFVRNAMQRKKTAKHTSNNI